MAMINNYQIIVLIDSKSTYNFIYLKIEIKLEIYIAIFELMGVKIANCIRVLSERSSSYHKFIIQGFQFKIQTLVIQFGVCNMVIEIH
jgi:hypothetical protein